MGEKFLSTWQYSADSAYVLIYFPKGNGLEIDIWDESTKSKVGEVFIDGFTGDVSDVKFYSVNDVVYLSHHDIKPKKFSRVTDTSSPSGYSFEVSDFDVKIDPILDEYADRNVFVMKAEGSVKAGDIVRVEEKPLTDGQKRNGAELLFTKDSFWRGTGNQMLMLKRSTEMMKTYGFLYPSNESGSSSVSVTQEPKPETIFQDEVGGKGKSTPWLFAFGKISVETSGKWSGRIVVDLWKPDMEVDDEGNPVEPELLAVLEVSNASSNKSISRDLTIAGSRIRIRCEERERAKAVTTTTTGSDDNLSIIYKNVDSDTGCFVTISNAQEIPIYLRIKDVVAPSGSDNGYAYCEAIHPFEGGFNSSSFAEGAWCAGRYGYPRTVGVFQERMVFGGNKVKPCTLWCSKTGDWSNFVQGAESTSPIFATANTDNIDAIQWMSIAKSYIMFGSLSGEWYFGSSDGGAVKPSNFSFQKLSNFGSTKGVDSVQFGDATIVAKNGGKEIIDVSYNTLSEQGAGSNLSLFASHLLESSSVKDIACTLSPKSILWVLDTEGKLLSFTYEGNNNVFAWSRHEILNGVSAITSFRRGERDILVMLVNDGEDTMLAELDPFAGDNYTPTNKEHIFEDEKADGSFVCYESRIIPTPITAGDGGTYGRKVNIKSLDVYLKTHNGDFDGYVWSDGTEFTVSISGQKHIQLCDGGWLKNNEKKDFGENRITLPITGGWTDLALVDIRTDYPAPLTITALGAQVSYGN
jgi:hypothetical protein